MAGPIKQFQFTLMPITQNFFIKVAIADESPYFPFLAFYSSTPQYFFFIKNEY